MHVAAFPMKASPSTKGKEQTLVLVFTDDWNAIPYPICRPGMPTDVFTVSGIATIPMIMGAAANGPINLVNNQKKPIPGYPNCN